MKSSSFHTDIKIIKTTIWGDLINDFTVSAMGLYTTLGLLVGWSLFHFLGVVELTAPAQMPKWSLSLPRPIHIQLG